LLPPTRDLLGKAGKKLRRVIADTRYSNGKIIAAVAETVIPYQANQKSGFVDLL
jgi:hypothetical protein